MRPVLLLEINEVPLRVWQRFAEDGRFPSVSRLVRESTLVQTNITDPGELSPWCTWPTFHRGLPKEKHGILHLGQDPKTYRGVPIWEEYRERRYSVGVFGSLQSWPPKDPGDGGFHVPDTFAPDEKCFPAFLEPLQAFNLTQVRANARVMNEKAVARPPGPRLLATMLAAGVRPRTLARIAKQLLAERINPALRERRVSFQAMLFWDVFRSLYDPARPPAFSTFFTNHIASVMHRYWHHIFPDDFPEKLRPADRRHARTMDFAVGVLEEILGDALSWRERNPELLILVANSMGQTAILRDSHEGFELLLRDPLRLLRAVALPGEAKQNLAMMPQVALEFPDEAAGARAEEALRGVTTLGGTPLFSCDRKGLSLSVTALTPKAKELERGTVKAGGKELTLEEAGLSKAEVEAGTAYHVPEGAIFAHGLGEQDARPAAIDAAQAKQLILGWAGI